MRALVEESGLSAHIEIESAGTGDWHAGHPRDSRSVAAGARRGFWLEGRARQFSKGDFEEFDYVLAMDRANFDNLVALSPSEAARKKIHLFRSFDPASPPGASVPDPYYTDGFDDVIDICVAGCNRLLMHIRDAHGLR